MVEIQTLVSWRIFRLMKRSHRWNNSPVVYPVVNVRGVSNIWSGFNRRNDSNDIHPSATKEPAQEI